MIDEEHIDRIAQFAQKELGVRVSQQRLKSVCRELGNRSASINLASLEEYLELVLEAKQVREREYLFSRLLVNTTEFFREPHHFHILGNILAKSQHSETYFKSSPFRVWSAGCSSGQEPYSIAMCALNATRRGVDVNVEVIGTDAANECIRKARVAQYSEAEVAMIGDRTLSKYFFRPNPQSSLFELDASVRDIVSFENLNLLDLMKTGKHKAYFHAVFCRNTLIYFTPSVRQLVVQYFAQCLKPSGFLFVGHSEDVKCSEFERVGKSVYQLKLTEAIPT